MNFNVAIKVEAVHEICDKLITVQSQEHKYELADVKGIKIEPQDDWCCESSLYIDHQVKDEVVIGPTEFHKQSEVKIEPQDDWCCESSLYIDHQVKDEVVIGPTEFYKQSEDSFQHPSDLACNICSKTYKRKGSFNRHMKTHNTPATSVEKRVPKLESQSILKKEKKVKTKLTVTKNNKMVYKIADCRNGEINHNLKREVDKKQNKCLLCLKTFTLPSNLTRHMRRVHEKMCHNLKKKKKKTSEKCHACDKCSRSFTRFDYLTRHKLIRHLEGKRFICECGKKFNDKATCTRHRREYCVLKSSAPFKLVCDYCNKTFSNKYRLTTHVKKHLNNTYLLRTYTCEHCNKQFPRKCEIERHMFQHLGTNLHKFKCQICNKKFTRNWGLKNHLISHTGKKPFTCKYCMRSFGSKWGCVCHERKFHPAEK